MDVPLHSPLPTDLDTLLPAVVICKLRALVVRLSTLEMRVVAYLPLSLTYFSQPSKTTKNSKFPLPTTSTTYLPPDTTPMMTRGTFPTPYVPPSHPGQPGMIATSSEPSDIWLMASTATDSRRVERTVKVELGERRDGSWQGGEERQASPVPTDAHVREQTNAHPHRGPKTPVLYVQPGHALGVLHPARPARHAPCPLPCQKRLVALHH
jgi:hypothetical protein